MDAIAECKASVKADDLVDTIAKLKQELTNACFKKYGAAKALEANAYASEHNVDVLRKSKMWKDASEQEEVIDPDDSNSRRGRSAMTTKLVGDLGFFNVHVAEVMGDGQIRLVVLFKTDSPVEEQWFGNVLIT